MGRTLSIFLERDELNQKLGGGIPVGSLVLIEGKNGDGKSVLSQRITFGLLKNNVTVTYISTELTIKGFIEQMHSLNYPCLNYLLDRKLLYFPVYPLLGRSKKRKTFLDTLLRSHQLYQTDVVIFDAFSSLVKYDLHPEKVYKVIEFFKKLCAKEKTIIITVDPTEIDEEYLNAIKGASDVYLELKTALMGGQLRHSIIVRRYSMAASDVADVVGFRVVPRIGFLTEISEVA